jgi:hypothetical protein
MFNRKRIDALEVALRKTMDIVERQGHAIDCLNGRHRWRAFVGNCHRIAPTPPANRICAHCHKETTAVEVDDEILKLHALPLEGGNVERINKEIAAYQKLGEEAPPTGKTLTHLARWR